MKELKIFPEQAKHIANKELYSVYRRTFFGVRFLCFCNVINEKDGIFSFVDTTNDEVVAIINKAEFAYATRNY